MKEIFLANGKGVALVDDDDYERVISAGAWCLHQQGYAAAYLRSSGKDGKRDVLLHRFILGEPEGLEVDHRNGNKLDCRKSNLRVATRRQNAANQPIQQRPKASQFKGVTWHRGAQK